MDERIITAYRIVEQLQEWLEDRDGLSAIPVAHFVYYGSFLGNVDIAIGNTTVFSTEADSEENMTFEACRDNWLEEIESFWPFLAAESEAHDE